LRECTFTSANQPVPGAGQPRRDAPDAPLRDVPEAPSGARREDVRVVLHRLELADEELRVDDAIEIGLSSPQLRLRSLDRGLAHEGTAERAHHGPRSMEASCQRLDVIHRSVRTIARRVARALHRRRP